MLEAPYPELDDLLHMMGEAGRHIAEIEASEGAAGNISVCLRWPVEPEFHRRAGAAARADGRAVHRTLRIDHLTAYAAGNRGLGKYLPNADQQAEHRWEE